MPSAAMNTVGVTVVNETTQMVQHTVYIIKVKLEAIMLLNVAYLFFYKSVIIFHRDPEPHDVFVPSWHEFECVSTVEAGLLQGRTFMYSCWN
jgi:hypothetical protein